MTLRQAVVLPQPASAREDPDALSFHEMIDPSRGFLESLAQLKLTGSNRSFEGQPFESEMRFVHGDGSGVS